MQDIQIRPGYKMTELGIIPEDWSSTIINKGVDLLTGYPFPSSKYSKNGIRLLRGSNIKRGIICWLDDNTQYWPKINNDIKGYTLKEGDIVIAMDGSLVGKSFARLTKNDIPALLLQRVARIRSEKIDMGYLKELICSNLFTRYCNTLKTSSAIPHISPKDIREYLIPLPPTLEEQESIAQVLSDTDELINSLDEQIEKKEKIKEGTMQELLTGKKRLPGFSGEWEIKKIGEILDVTRGYVLSVSKMSQSNSELHKYPVYSSQTKNKGLTGYYKEFLYENSITWTTDGANAGDVNFREGKFYCTNVCGVLKSNNGYANLCVAKTLGMISKKYVSYIGNPKLMNNVVANIELKLPPTIEEQKVISQILSDIDIEIENLKTKRDKYRLIKEGMMQELLTGRIRLI